MGRFSRRLTLAAALAALLACSGGGGDPPPPPPPPTEHLVDLTWSANRERGVNAPGGGYRVDIPGRPTIDVPYVSGDFAPTSLSTTLFTGSYTVAVRAYAALDVNGGNTGSLSAPATLVVHVP